MRDYAVELHPSEGGSVWMATMPDLADCAARATTPVDALYKWIRARDAWLAAARAKGGRKWRTKCSISAPCCEWAAG